MARMSEAELTAYRAESRRATERAKAVLRPGDILTVASCPGTKRWIRFAAWDGNWICSATRNDFHAMTVTKRNGVPISFRDAADRQPAAVGRPAGAPAAREANQ